MSRYFIIVIATGLVVLIALLLSLFSFHAAPGQTALLVLGTFATPAAFLFNRKEDAWRPKREKQAP